MNNKFVLHNSVCLNNNGKVKMTDKDVEMQQFKDDLNFSERCPVELKEILKDFNVDQSQVIVTNSSNQYNNGNQQKIKDHNYAKSTKFLMSDNDILKNHSNFLFKNESSIQSNPTTTTNNNLNSLNLNNNEYFAITTSKE